MRRVVIIGGGIIGLSTAYALYKQGVPEITIVDAAEGPNGASIVNAGWICPAHSDPVPAPGLIGKSMRWMLHSDSPLYIKPSVRDPDLAKWLFSFWRSCNQKDYDHAIAALAALNQTTFPLFDDYTANDVRFQMERVGLLCAFLNPRNLEHELEHIEHYKMFSLALPEAKWGQDARDLEPALSDSVNGSFLIEGERHIRPDTLTTGLIDWLDERAVDFRWNTRVTGFDAGGKGVTAVQIDGGPIAADAVVIAAGARTGLIVKQLGMPLPIQGGKGYSIDYDTPPTQISHPISLFEARMAMTPMGAWTRLAGTMELSGINMVVRQERVAALARGASRFIRNWSPEVGTGRVSGGLRPMTPDGMPIIDLLPGYSNVAVNTGHQMLGLTLGPASGALLADLLLSGKRDPVLEPFAASRFR
jgi:D-amino-acid dehydrogenase